MPSEYEQARRKILEAFGLNEGECEIENLAKNLFGLNESEEIEATMEGNSVYAISPKQSNHEKLPIKQIGNLNIFNEYNLIFVLCIFKVELLIERKTITKGFHFQECTFEKRVSLNGSIFNGRISFDLDDDNTNSLFKQSLFKSTLSCKNSIFNAKVAFFKSEFNTNAYFQGATFNEYAHFKGANFNGVADFCNAKFKSGAIFSEAHFNYKTNRKYGASFKATKFFGYAWFKKATFCNNVDFEAAIFEKDVLFNKVIFSKLAYFPNVGFYGLARFSDVIFHKSFFGGSRFKERAFFQRHIFKEMLFSPT